MIPAPADIERARDRLRPFLTPTPLEEAVGMPGLWLKLENANKTHSFKCRGALNAILTMEPEARSRGVVAASSGNHAQGVAFAARLLGVQARIVMPEGASRRKVAGVRRLGAEPILFGDTYDEAEAEAHRLCRELGATWLSPYNDPAVIAGGGTVGLEILEQLPGVARIVVPVGGGGLISGIALAVRDRKPDVEIVGVNALASPDFYNEFYQLEHALDHDTLADALPGAIEAGSITRDVVGQYVDRIVLVSEEDIRRAMQFMLFEQGWIAEGGGVVGLAAIENGGVELDRPTVAVISGGNVDADILRDILDVWKN
jgi:threonine dehydratase